MNIDKQALLEWLNEQANNFAGFGHEGTEAIRYIRWRIESGDFDTPSVLIAYGSNNVRALENVKHLGMLVKLK